MFQTFSMFQKSLEKVWDIEKCLYLCFLLIKISKTQGKKYRVHNIFWNKHRKSLGHRKMLGLCRFCLAFFWIWLCYRFFLCPKLFLCVLKKLCSKKHKYFWKNIEKCWVTVVFALNFQKNIEKVWDIEKICNVAKFRKNQGKNDKHSRTFKWFCLTENNLMFSQITNMVFETY